jgi:hypothetical protein
MHGVFGTKSRRSVMNRITSIAALACGFALTALSPALAQGEMPPPGKGLETRQQELRQQEEMRRQEEMRMREPSGRSSAGEPAPKQYHPEMGTGQEEQDQTLEGVDPAIKQQP